MARPDIRGIIAFTAAAGGALLLAQKSAARRRTQTYDFRGKSVLINGGSRGLGLVLARDLARAGARLAITARDERELEIAKRELEHLGSPSVLTVSCDSRDAQAVESMVDRVIREHGGIDVLFNVAGTILVGPIETMTLDDYHEQMDSNYWSAVNVCYYAVPHMQQRGEGRIVNVSSIGGKVAVPHLAPYCAGKFALGGWSRTIRAELMKDGIVVTTVFPGLMRTGSPRHAMFKGQNEKEYAWFSIGDSLPGLTMSAEHASHDILEATRKGEAEIVLSMPAKIGALVDQIVPEITSDIAALAARMLPKPGGIGTRSLKGYDSESKLSPSALTTLTDEAAQRNNEMQR